nr:TolC family protein [uncultured Roseococcus sp.]
MLSAGQVLAQGWFTDRSNNAIVNVDTIDARFREQVGSEIRGLYRPSTTEEPSARDRERAVRFTPWWMRGATTPTEEGQRALPIGLGFMYDSAMLYSQQMRSFGDLPAIRETTEREVAGRFIPRFYAEGRYANINEPTQSLATTGGAARLIQRERVVEFGLRQRAETGGEVTVGQRFSNFSTNSTFYNPRAQASSRTFITVVQPLLRESGTNYTRSLHEVARLDSRSAVAEFRRQMESHLSEVARAYWTLWLTRVQYQQRQRLLGATQSLVSRLEGRGGVDAGLDQTIRARAAVTTREADVLRARAAVRNAEARLRGLVNDPRLERDRFGELVPTDRPLRDFQAQRLESVMVTAVAYRPEVQQAFLQHRASVLREGQAQIEALPRLDIIVEGNMSGRAGDRRFGEAFTDARREADTPGGVFGFRFEVPLGSDDARARLSRRRLETRQAESQTRAVLATIVTEAEVTLNEYRVAYREVGARAAAVQAAEADIRVQRTRFEEGTFPAGGADALERLLQSQDRLTAAEEAAATAQAAYTLAFVQLQRVAGTFTALEQIDVRRIDDANRGPAYVARRGAPETPRPGAGAVQPASR